ncbi:MAG: DinB family protein [Gemmatimonadota bacterium]|nr:DinB family protein [Gemmatimonadota bacterium]
MKRIALLFFFVVAAPADGQQAVSANPTAAVTAARNMWQAMTNYITAAAEQMPEKDYAFRPTHDVRTFGQMIGHVAGAQAMICAAALGEKGGGEDDIEKTATTKAALLAALKATTQSCQRAYAQSDVASTGATTLFGGPTLRINALVLNAAHNAEHYGNLVTYLRIRGMTPPSSQPMPPRT